MRTRIYKKKEETFDNFSLNKAFSTPIEAITHIDDIHKITNLIDKKIELISTDSKGLYTVGGKLHFSKSISDEDIQAFKDEFHFTSTIFTMQHANRSMILPPVYSANELSLLCMIIQKAGLIDKQTDLQIDLPGRLPNELCGILGGCILLSTDVSMNYKIDTFSTNQDELTGARFMTYDVYNTVDTSFKGLPKSINGRTSVLGRKSFVDIYTTQYIGSLLSQTIHGGPYKNLGIRFIKDYKRILHAYGMSNTLEQERVFDRVKIRSTPEEHLEMINLYNTERDFYQQSKHNEKTICLGLEVNNLIQEYIASIISKQKKLK